MRWLGEDPEGQAFRQEPSTRRSQSTERPRLEVKQEARPEKPAGLPRRRPREEVRLALGPQMEH